MRSKQKSCTATQSAGLPNAQRPPHLTAEQMEAMLRDSPFRKQAGKHLQTCTSCRQEVDALADLLGRFRATSVLHAEKTQARYAWNEPAEQQRRLPVLTPLPWAIAAGALACALVTPPVLHFMARETAVAPAAVGKAAPARTVEISDEALLEGVRDDLAISVPAPLQPLAATSSGASGADQSAGESSGRHRSSAARASH